MVDVVITGVSGRAQMADASRRFAGLPPDARRGDETRRGQGPSSHEIAAAAS
jgi:hypothetical protein